MSTIKLNIQLFGGGGGWTEGVTQSAVNAAYDQFSAKIDEVQTAIMNFGPVDGALTAGWIGQDCVTYLERFHQHAQNVCNHIDEYRTAVKATVNSILSQWESFQASLVS